MAAWLADSQNPPIRMAGAQVTARLAHHAGRGSMSTVQAEISGITVPPKVHSGVQACWIPRKSAGRRTGKGNESLVQCSCKNTGKESFPMDIIQQTLLKFLQEVVEALVRGEAMDFGSRMKEIGSASQRMLTTLLSQMIERLDESLFRSRQDRQWVVVRRDRRVLTTAFGELSFTRRYYRHKTTGEYAYLLDKYLGIQTHAKVNGDVRNNAVAHAASFSYSKSARLSTESSLSKMSVANYIRQLGRFPQLKAEGDRRSVKWLYVEADEDHVSLQDGKKVQVKLVYIHEGILEQGKRHILRNPRYLTWPLKGSTEELWNTVADYIAEQYDLDALERIFLSGDAASWIRSGEEYLYPCTGILDSFHLMKGLRRFFGANDRKIGAFLDCARREDFVQAKELCLELLRGIPEKEKREKKAAQARYLLENWERICNRSSPGALGCSAEGHVSHILSERLSCRPLGWSRRNLMNISCLRVMMANGQSIRYEELRMKPPNSREAPESREVSEVIHAPGIRRALKRTGRTISDGISKNLPVLNSGIRSSLYRALNGLSLNCAAC